MGYKTPDQLTNTTDGIVQGIGKALSIWQGWNSIMDSVAYREDKAIARKKAITDATISQIDKVGVQMKEAMKSGDTRLAGKFNVQIKEMGGKIKDTGDPRIRTAYKTYRTLGDDIANDIKVMDRWDSYLTDAESTGGKMSYDFFAKETTKAGLDRAIQTSRKELREWKKTLTTNNISNIADHKGWITRHEAMLDRLIQIAGVDGTLPTSASAEERQMFISSITGEGYKTPKETYDHLEKTNNIRKDLVNTNELAISELDTEINTLRYKKDPLMSDAEAQDQISQKETLMRNLETKNIQENTLIEEMDAKLADKAYDWAGRGENEYNFDTENYGDLGEPEKKVLKDKIDTIIALQSEGRDAGWEEPKGGLSVDKDGMLIYDDGRLYNPEETNDIYTKANNRKLEHNKLLDKTEEENQIAIDTKNLGAETYGQLIDAKLGSLPTNVADYDLTKKEFNQYVTRLNTSHQIKDQYENDKKEYEIGMKKTANIETDIKNIQLKRQIRLQDKTLKRHSEEWKETEKEINRLKKRKQELKVNRDTLKGGIRGKFFTPISDRQKKKFAPIMHDDFSQEGLDKIETRIYSIEKSIELAETGLRSAIKQP
jgi:hypothetical protein